MIELIDELLNALFKLGAVILVWLAIMVFVIILFSPLLLSKPEIPKRQDRIEQGGGYDWRTS